MNQMNDRDWKKVEDFARKLYKLMSIIGFQPSGLPRKLNNPIPYMGMSTLDKIKELIDDSGVYFVCYFGRIIYIGKSKSIRNRWIYHDIKSYFNSLNCVNVEIYWIDASENEFIYGDTLTNYERYFISVINPILNLRRDTIKNLISNDRFIKLTPTLDDLIEIAIKYQSIDDKPTPTMFKGEPEKARRNLDNLMSILDNGDF